MLQLFRPFGLGVLTVWLGLAPVDAQQILGSSTYRPEIFGSVGVVAAGRHFATEAGLRMLRREGNATDAGVAAVAAAAVTEISHFGLGGEAPIILYLAAQNKTVVINGQGIAPAAAAGAVAGFRERGAIPANGPSAGAVPAVIDALAIALAEYGTLSFAEVLQPAIELADGFPWYPFLGRILKAELANIRRHPSGAKVYLQGPDGGVPEVGSRFRQPELARTLRALVEEEQQHLSAGSERRAAIYAARDLFYKGTVGQAIAAAVQRDGGLLDATDLAAYRGRVEAPTRLRFSTEHGEFEVFKTGFWGQGPVLLQTLALLQGFDLAALGHNSVAYIHTVSEALKLALADRDAYYGDPDFSDIPATGLLSPAYAAERRRLIDPQRAHNRQRPGQPWRFEANPKPAPAAEPIEAMKTAAYRPDELLSPDTTSINAVDAEGNLFSSAPSSAWFYGGVYIAGDTGVPLGNRMQAFVLDADHPNVLAAGKRPRTTLSPTVVLRDGEPFLALSTPGGDSQDQQLLQVLLNITVFGMRPQQAVEAPRFNSLQYRQSFGDHRIRPGVLLVEDRVPAATIEALEQLGHRVKILGAFMLPSAVTVVGVSRFGTLFGAADVRGQRYVAGW